MKRQFVVRPTPEQRAEMAAYIDAREPGWLDELGISREEPDFGELQEGREQ